MNGYAAFMGSQRIKITYDCGFVTVFRTDDNTPTEGIKWRTSPGRGVFPVGQFDAQNLFPNGRGIPSLASSIARKFMYHNR